MVACQTRTTRTLPCFRACFRLLCYVFTHSVTQQRTPAPLTITHGRPRRHRREKKDGGIVGGLSARQSREQINLSALQGRRGEYIINRKSRGDRSPIDGQTKDSACVGKPVGLLLHSLVLCTTTRVRHPHQAEWSHESEWFVFNLETMSERSQSAGGCWFIPSLIKNVSGA